jgi:hypothetical protein
MPVAHLLPGFSRSPYKGEGNREQGEESVDG